MTTSKHILLVSFPAWGHSRPLIALACKIVVQQQNSVVTLLTAGFLKRTQKEIERHLPGTNPLKARIRVISTIKEEIFKLSDNLVAVEDGFKSIYDALFDNRSVICLSTSKIFQDCSWPMPRVVIADMFLPVFKYIRYKTPKSRIFLFNSGNAAAILRLIGSEEVGGLGDVRAKAQAVARITGEDVDEVAKKMFRPAHGEVINLAGLPPMYDYEMTPQESRFNDLAHVTFLNLAADFLRKADGVISVSSMAYESASVEAFRRWLLEFGRDLYAIGPLLPPTALSTGAEDAEKDMAHNGSETVDFLNHILKNNGRHSLIYISFGSVFWPRIDYLMKIIGVLLELKFPFILAHGSPMAVIPPELTDRVNASGIGHLSSWTPQQLILNHPVTGWFLTHCGQNSVVEALNAGVPMIAWPMDADQPINALHLTLTHDVAYELCEVRTGEAGLKPLLRGIRPRGTLEAVEVEARKVFQAARGSDGERKRHNAHVMSGKMNRAWEEGGDAAKELSRFFSNEYP